MKYQATIVCLIFAGAGVARGDQEFYVTASVGRVLGRYDTALTNVPFARYEKSRDALSPSLAVGDRFSKLVGVELGYTGDGSYQYDYEYGISPFARPGGTIAAVTQRLFIREKLYDVALSAPIRIPLGSQCTIELCPGIARQELDSRYSARFVSVTAGVTPVSSPGSTAGITQVTDVPLFTQTTGRWAFEGGARISWSMSPTFALVGGYQYTQAPQKNISVLRFGLSARY
jgi:hypothetical protein